MENPFTLTGKIILVTGASSGIGQATARLCANLGASVVITGRNADRLQQTLDSLPGEGHRQILADLTDAVQRSSLVQQLPTLDGVVHSAGMGHRKPVKLLTEEDVVSVMNVNFNATALLQSVLLAEKKINKGLPLSSCRHGRPMSRRLPILCIAHPKGP